MSQVMGHMCFKGHGSYVFQRSWVICVSKVIGHRSIFDVIMSVCHYVSMSLLSSAHYGQCVVGCLYIYVNSTLVLVVMSSLFSCQCI